jgi:serine protease
MAMTLALVLVPALGAIAGPSQAAEFDGARARPAADHSAPVERVIVKLRGTGAAASAKTPAADRLNSVSKRSRFEVKTTRALGGELHAMQIAPLSATESASQTLARLRADPDVEYAEVDRPVYAHAVPNDPLAAGQWYLGAAQVSSVNATAAWDVTTGSKGLVIAVLDTGVRFDHPDLLRSYQGGRYLPGYDFVSANPLGNFKAANDGDGRDPDASDPGDWVTTADKTTTCTDTSNSSWHGTLVSGIIGANTNNGVGVAGLTWSGWLLPVRVLGKCGGLTSDVLAGMQWAAGRHVDGVPDNPYPAQIINVSLGSEGGCDSASADVVSQLASDGVLIVVSAGNEKGAPVDSPANCPGAAGIAGLRHAGTRVGYSNLGPEIALSAPGGNCVNVNGGPCLFSIDSTSNDGATTPGNSTYSDQVNYEIGTSFSAPIVSGIAGLMLSVNGNLKASQLIARLKEGATKPFPTTSDTGPQLACHAPSTSDLQPSECACTTDTCGAGIANAKGAVDAALRPIAAISAGTVAGNTVTLQANGSAAACRRTLSAFAWSVVTASGTPPVIGGASTDTAVVNLTANGTATLRLTVTDDSGRTDTADVQINGTSVTSLAPASAGTHACLADLAIAKPLVTVAATDANAAEAGLDPGTFTFTRTLDVSLPQTVAIAASGSATAGSDYTALPSTITLAAGQASTTLTVTPVDDTLAEGTETVTVSVLAGANYDAGNPASATVSIADNDTVTVVATAPAASGNGGGGGGGGSFDFALLAALACALTVSARRAPRNPRAA